MEKNGFPKTRVFDIFVTIQRFGEDLYISMRNIQTRKAPLKGSNTFLLTLGS